LLGSMVSAVGVAAAGLVVAVVAGGSLVALLVPLWLTLGLIGLTNPLPTALALSRHGEAAGAAAALLGAARFAIGAGAAPIVSLLGNDDVSIIAVMTAALTASFLDLLLVRRSL